jgi:hypothetical protein
MAEKFTTFPDIPIQIEGTTQENYDRLVNREILGVGAYAIPGPVTRKQLFDIYWTKEYSYTFSLTSKYGGVNKGGTKNSYTSVQRKGQKRAYLTPTIIEQGVGFGDLFLNEEDRESLGELNDSDPRKALISYVTATCQVATGDNFLAKGLCTNPIQIKKEASQEEMQGAQPVTRYEASFDFGTTTSFYATDKKIAPVGTPFAAFNIIKINPETDKFEQTDKYYFSPVNFGGFFYYQEGQESEESERIIRYSASFRAYPKSPGLNPSFPNFKKIGDFKFYDVKPLEIWGDQQVSVLERVATGDSYGNTSYIYEPKEESAGAFSVDFTVASSSKFNFEI